MANTSPQAKMLTQIGLLRGHCTRLFHMRGSAQQHTSLLANVYDVMRPTSARTGRRGAFLTSLSAGPSPTAKQAVGCLSAAAPFAAGAPQAFAHLSAASAHCERPWRSTPRRLRGVSRTPGMDAPDDLRQSPASAGHLAPLTQPLAGQPIVRPIAVPLTNEVVPAPFGRQALALTSPAVPGSPSPPPAVRRGVHGARVPPGSRCGSVAAQGGMSPQHTIAHFFLIHGGGYHCQGPRLCFAHQR